MNPTPDESGWALIERATSRSGNDPEEKEATLRGELEALSPEQIVAFARFFDEKDRLAYRWDLWAAAYILHGGCSDDSFMDFRASLICMGQKVFEAALADPDSLADVQVEDPEEDLFYEGYQYLASEVYSDKTGEELPQNDVSWPSSPEGDQWDEDCEEDLKRLCPRLHQKYSA